MFRKNIAAALTAVLLLVCTACDQNTVAIKPTEENTPDDSSINVQILNVETTEDETVLHVLWRNDTNDPILYGEIFGLERWEEDRWVNCSMRENTGFITIGYMLEPGKSVTKAYKLNWVFGKLAAGHYRFTTSCSLMQDGMNQDYNLSAEFDLGVILENSEDNSTDVKLCIAGEVISLNAQHSKIVYDILSDISFNTSLTCSCQPEYQLLLPNGDCYGIHLEDGYVCCIHGQSELEKRELEALASIIDWALEETKAR